MKKIIRFLIVLVFLVQASKLSAQGVDLSVVSMTGFPTQAYYNQTYTFSAIIQNYGTSDYQGSLQLNFSVTNSNVTTDSLSFGSFQVNLPGNSTDTIDVAGYSFDSTAFKMGGNVVVVWPVSNTGIQITVNDTFSTNIEILGISGINDPYEVDFNAFLYPVPATNELFISLPRLENDIEHVRIMDALGRQKFFSTRPTSFIDVSTFENGTYFIEVREKSGTIHLEKFLVTH